MPDDTSQPKPTTTSEPKPSADTAESDFGEILGKLTERLKSFVTGLATLEVYTLVGELDVSVTRPRDGAPPAFNFGKVGKSIQVSNGAYSAINIASGDVKTVWSAQLDPARDAALFKQHADNVALSQKIFADNVKMVRDLIKDITS